MRLIIRTRTSQKPIEVRDMSELDEKIRSSFKIDRYDLFSDKDHTTPLDYNTLRDGSTIFLRYEKKEIKASKEERRCNHSPNAVCSKCASLDPLKRTADQGVNVKYMSYESYKEVLKREGKKETEYDYVLKKCSDHSEKTRCMRCMDKVITLIPQVFRRIDYVEFDNKVCVEELIKRWRNSGRQQFGLLVGSIRSHSDLPLAKKAVVYGIWDVEAESYPDGLFVSSVPEKFIVDDLIILGFIYTDLFNKDSSLYSHKISHNYSISTLELLFIYKIWLNIKKDEFVGICVTAEGNNNIILHPYMLTDQFIALCNADALCATNDPAYFTSERTIKYMIKNEYDKAVGIDAKERVPVDYFVVKCEAGYSKKSFFLSNVYIKKPTLYQLAKYFNNDFSFEKYNNFSLLTRINKFYPRTNRIIKGVLSQNKGEFQKIEEEDEYKQFVETIREVYEGTWTCSTCTYINPMYSSECEICNTSKMQ